MTEPLYLLVPVALDTLVVNEPLNAAVTWARWTASYDNWRNYDPPLPTDPNAELPKPQAGVHLKWAMPDALTNAKLNSSSGAFEFPLLPNRWLVTRLSPGTQSDRPKVAKSWLVESDVTVTDTSASVYLNPTISQITPDNVLQSQIFIGRKTPLEDVTAEQVETSNGVKAYLRAVGPGDVSFAAYQPSVRTVFSFYDSLQDLGDPGQGVSLTYILNGWYSQPGDDPLAGVNSYVVGGPWQPPSSQESPQQWWTNATPAQRFQQLMNAYQWSIGKVKVPAQPPALTLYNALTYDVKWQTTEAPPSPNGGPDEWPGRIKIAVGATATEAISALAQVYSNEAGLGTAGATVAELLEAAQLGELPLVDQADGQQKLDRRIHDARFSSEPGGTIWRVVKTGGDQSPGNEPPVIGPAVKTWLDEINGQQRTLDLASRQLIEMQRNLYGLWWKNGKANAPFNQPPGFWSQQRWDEFKGEITAALPTQAAAVAAQIKQVKTLASNLPSATAGQINIDAWVAAHPPQGGLPKGLQLKGAAMPRFWSPNDPVVLAAGIKRSNSHGADGRGQPDSQLPCRLPESLIMGVEFDSTRINAGTGTGELTPSDVPVPSGPGVPKLDGLFTEAVFVDPTNAAELANIAGKGSDQDFINGLSSAIAAGKGFDNGVAPAALGLGPWVQPFVPLYLEWAVNFYPTYKPVSLPGFNPPGDGQGWEFDLSFWSFDGTDYSYQGGELCTQHMATYAGRTLMTAHSGDNLVSKITKFLTSPPRTESAEVKNLLSMLDEPYLLSQALSGLTRQLAMWVEEQNVPPFGTVPGNASETWAGLIGNQYHAVPAVSAGDVARVQGQGVTPYFFPIRAGFFTFTKLNLIDGFGQIIDLLWGNNNKLSAVGLDKTFEPILGAGLVPDKAGALTPPPGYAMLRPRLSPSARLNLTLEPVDGTGDTLSGKNTDTGQAPPVGPSSPSDGLCGWVLPNHLDFGLSFYSAEGAALGELIALPRGSGVTVNWQPAPGPNGVAKADIPNDYLRQIVDSFAPDNLVSGADFQAFLSVIDETMWTINPLGGRSDQNLSVLIGRPLAVLRAQLQLSLNGGALGDQSWQFTSPALRAPLTWGYQALTFPVRLGDPNIHDDGLIGYYLDDNYAVFNAVHPGSTSYIKAIGPGDDVQLAPNTSSKAELTMLVDPRAPVHAFTGLLPVKSISFPSTLLDGFLDGLGLTFRTGPMITDNQSVRIPAPAERHGSFKWLQQSEPGTWTTDPVVRVSDTARVPASRQVIREGWLALDDLENKQDTS